MTNLILKWRAKDLTAGLYLQLVQAAKSRGCETSYHREGDKAAVFTIKNPSVPTMEVIERLVCGWGVEVETKKGKGEA